MFLSASAGEPPGWTPPGPFWREFSPPRETASILPRSRLLCSMPTPCPAGRGALFTLCTAMMAQRGQSIPESHDEHVVFQVPWVHLRTIVEALPEARRDALVARLVGKPSNDNAARVQVRYVLPILDLATGPKAQAAISGARTHLEGLEQWADLLATMDAGGGPPPERDGPTEECRDAVEYWLNEYEATRRVEAIGDTAREAHDRAVVVDAPELASFEAWNAASEARRSEVAEQVAANVEGLSFVGLETFDAGTLASFAHGELVFRLVPGGTYDRGFSAEEEARVRAASDEAKPPTTTGSRSTATSSRTCCPRCAPGIRVRRPCCCLRLPGYAMEPSAVTSFLEETHGGCSRRPSGSTSPAAARNTSSPGAATQCPMRRGSKQPRGAKQRSPTRSAAGDSVYSRRSAPTHGTTATTALPTNGSPRFGNGPRVARGGAAMLHPWQQVGEWQLLCSAVRTPSVHWEFELNVRPALSILAPR